jgi:hypothetical protein
VATASETRAYAWFRIAWGRLTLLTAPLAVLIGISNGREKYAHVAIALVSELGLVVFTVGGFALVALLDFGSFRALQLAVPDRSARAMRRHRRAGAWQAAIQDARHDVKARKLAPESVDTVKELVRAVISADRARFEQLYCNTRFPTDEARRRDLMIIGLGLLSMLAGRRQSLRRRPPDIDRSEVLRRLFGTTSTFADRAYEPFATQLLGRTGALRDEPAEAPDVLLTASEIGATTALLVGALVLQLDTEGLPPRVWATVYDRYMRALRSRWRVKIRAGV